MKTTLYISIILAASICTTSCRKEPRACISYTPSYGAIYTGETIQFQSCSQGAYAWNWNFGDGSRSSDQNTDHVYDSVGTFMVTLTVYSKGDMETNTISSAITIEKTFKEKLAGRWNWTRKDVKTYSNNLLISDNSTTINDSINFINDSMVVISDTAVSWWVSDNDEITIGIYSWESWDVQFADSLGNNSDDYLILTENEFNGPLQDGTRRKWYCNK